MAPLPPIANVVKVIVTGTTTPGEWANLFHASYAGPPPTSAQLDDISGQLADAWTAATGITKLQTADTAIGQVEVVDLSSDMGAAGVTTVGVAGTNGEDPLPGNVCTLVSYKISRRYRGGHPRSYLNAGGDGNLLDMSHWNSGYLTEAHTALGIWVGALGAVASGGCSLTGMVCVSYVDRNINPVPPYRRTVPLVEPITFANTVVDEQLASQRRRIGRR